jgi:hypothetical protein
MSGFLGVFQEHFDEEMNLKEWRRIDSLVTGDVFGELYLI